MELLATSLSRHTDRTGGRQSRTKMEKSNEPIPCLAAWQIVTRTTLNPSRRKRAQKEAGDGGVTREFGSANGEAKSQRPRLRV